MMMMLMRIGSSSVEQCSWLNNGDDDDDADEDRCYSRTMQLVIPCRPESAMIMVMVMMLMRIGVIVEQCSWLSPAGQNLR